MPEMAWFERAFCRSAPWRWFAREVVLPWALQGEEPTGEVLEIGSGSGAMAVELLAEFPTIRLTATDFDESMVTATRERLRRFGERARCQRADATDLPFDDGSFDTVLSFIMLHHVIDWERALREAVRVLRPAGRLVGYDLLPSVPMHVFHQVEGSRHRMMRLEELRREVRELPVLGVTTPGLAGLTVRFSFEKR